MREIVNNMYRLKTVSDFWAILFLSVLNLIFMHYCVAKETNLVSSFKLSMLIGCILNTFVDVLLLFFLSYYILFKKIKVALCLTFLITLFWSFSNVLYSRFFHHYITLSAVSQIGNVINYEMMKCIIDGLKIEDYFLLLFLILFVVLYFKFSTINFFVGKFLNTLFFTLFIYEILIFLYYTNYSRAFPLYDSNGFNFRQGSIVSLVIDYHNYYNSTNKLTEEQISQINDFKLNNCNRACQRIKQGKSNVVFILVESFMSFVTDMKVSGKDVTPFLNSLKNDSTIYYNGNMNENVTLGESSDGQFIYMTGLLPLRSSITVSKVRYNTLPSLSHFYGETSRMIIPTKKEMWLQDEMCHKYDISMLFTCEDIDNGRNTYLNDEQIFRLAKEKDLSLQQPFFSVILTMSMHQPYTQQIDNTFFINEPSIPNDLACYLNACHYTDKQINSYFEHLKNAGLYEESLIVIASDHSVHNTNFGGVSNKLPLFIINGGISPSNMWHGECNQIDLYTTLLDLMGGEYEWCGLGHSLVSPNYTNVISDSIWEMSESIIMGDYFSE